MIEPEVAEYADSGKFTVMAGAPPGGDGMKRRLSDTGRHADAVGYREGGE